MLPLTRSRNRARFFGTPFSPEALFAGGTVAGAWYDPSDLTTLFTTSAGTTPVAMPGQGSAVSVGAILDKRATGYSAFCAGAGERYSVPAGSAFSYGTGAFTVEAWIYATAINDRFVYSQTTSGQNYFGLGVGPTGTVFFIFGSGGGTSISSPASTIATNTWYHIAVVREGTGTNQTKLYVNGVQQAVGTCSFNFTNTTYNPTVGGYTHTTTNSFSGYISNLRVVKGTAVYSGAFTPSGPLTAISGTSLLTAGIAWSGNPAFTNAGARVDGLNPFTASPVGNHAIAFNDTTARPELRARVNLLTYSEEFDNGAWGKVAATVTANTTVAPDGTTTAETFATTAPGGGYVYSTLAAAAATYTMSVYAKANTANQIRLDFVTTGFSNGGTCVFTLTGSGSAGSVTQFGGSTGYVASITSVGNGWYRCSLTGAATATTWYYELANLANGQSVFIWGADLRPANIGANVPAYQRIADANTYDTSGFPLYLRFDGIDDSMYTPANLNLSGTDKVAVFAGVRKLSDAATAILAELSAASDANNGAFGMFAPANSGANSFAFRSRGTVQASAEPGVVAAAPVTRVQTGIADISAPVVTLRLNGTQAATNTATQGTGNYGTYPLFIGSRNNASARLNGHLYSLAVVGSTVSAGNIAAMESWVAGRTGIAI